MGDKNSGLRGSEPVLRNAADGQWSGMAKGVSCRCLQWRRHGGCWSEYQLGGGGVGLGQAQAVEPGPGWQLGLQQVGKVEQEVLGGGVEGQHHKVGEGMAVGLESGVFAEDQGVVEAVYDGVLHYVFDGVEVEAQAVACHGGTFDGDVEVVGMTVQVGALAIVAVEGVGHLEGYLLGE